MTSSTLTDPLNWIASILMALNGIFGIVCNGLIVYSFTASSSERTSFNLICAYRAVINIIILGWGFLGTFVPLTLLGDSIFPPEYHMVVITSVHSLYVGLQYCEFLVAFNRFCAMYIPLLYPTLFSIKTTFVFITAIFSYRLGKVIYELIKFIPIKCFSYYSSVDLMWVPASGSNCREKYVGVVDGTAIIIGILIAINLATFVKLSLFYKSTELDSRDIKLKMRRNRTMFMQTILQDMAYLIDVIFTFQLSDLFVSRLWTFISGSFIWQCVHSLDGGSAYQRSGDDDYTDSNDKNTSSTSSVDRFYYRYLVLYFIKMR
ncbi:hypothetical protein B9Z55_019054 [Caenorhabditis nigoni]|uniref:7TM GPCR serpentine receptor class x (Srx) domain-containing protein n=1 Tax=Caenorhabditis nigoni TaxID=1611254 RepID=A0A2G5TGP5_9PELO|nr:hypothetical protein B9Z55_019054 [Caenorhabditis nigoni]